MYGFNNPSDIEELKQLSGKKVAEVIVYEHQTIIKLEDSTELSIEGKTEVTKNGADGSISELKGKTIKECNVKSAEALKILFEPQAFSLKIYDTPEFETLIITYPGGEQIIV